jgi:hypothetical protein
VDHYDIDDLAQGLGSMGIENTGAGISAVWETSHDQSHTEPGIFPAAHKIQLSDLTVELTPSEGWLAKKIRNGFDDIILLLSR